MQARRDQVAEFGAIPSEPVRKILTRLENSGGPDDVDRNVMGPHSFAGHSLSDKAFIDHMFARLSPVLPQGAQLHNESTTTGKEKSDGSSR